MTIEGVIRRVLFVVCLMLGPAILLAIELFHPANFTAHPGMYQFLSHAEHGGAQFKALAYFGPDWWFTLHMIQTPLVGLVAIGLWLLADKASVTDDWIASACCWLARVAIFVFLMYLTAQQVDGVVLLLDRSVGRRRGIVRQPDRVLGGVRGVGVSGRRAGMDARGRVADPPDVAGLRLGAADKPCESARAGGVRAADYRVNCTVVAGAEASNHAVNRARSASVICRPRLVRRQRISSA